MGRRDGNLDAAGRGDDVAHPLVVQTDHGHARGQGLEDHGARSVAQAGEHKHVRPATELLQGFPVGQMTHPGDPGIHVEPLG